MACGDVLSLEDLQTAKKHQIFEAEVITGKVGGVAGGASIDYATNQVTGQTQKTLPAVLRDAGFRPASFTFATGGTLAVGDSDVVVLWPISSGGDGRYYLWKGAYPKVVPASSSPATTGGVSDSGWLPWGDITLRSELASASGAGLIGFAASLPDVQTVSLDKFLPKTSPLSYGATFDGIDDDTAGINKAIKAKGPNSYAVIQFPAGATSKILGTVLIPSGVKIDLNGCIVNGSGSNVMFESGKWVGSNIVSSFNDAPETTLTVDAWIGNGLIQNCMTAVKINNWVAGCRVYNLRGYHVNQMLHEKRSFYCEFHNLMAWGPLDGTLLPCFHWETAIQAQGVKRCFAVGYTKGHTIQGPNDMESFDTCGAEGCVDGVYITGTASLGGGGSGLTLRNWYFENNGTAIKADQAYTYENVDIDNCLFNENFVTIDGPTILSGRFGRMNKVKTSVTRPGNVNMLGNQAGLNGFTIELEDIADSANRTTPTMDTVGRFYVGPNVRIERVITLTDSAGAPYARNVESPNLPVERITGNQFGAVPNNTVPFCETFYSAPTLNVKTQVPYQDFAMLSYNISVLDTTGGPYWVRGVVMGDQVFPLSAGQKTVTLQNNGGFVQLSISTFIGAASYRGVVKLL